MSGGCHGEGAAIGWATQREAGVREGRNNARGWRRNSALGLGQGIDSPSGGGQANVMLRVKARVMTRVVLLSMLGIG